MVRRMDVVRIPSDADCYNIQNEIQFSPIGMLEMQVTAASSELVAEIVFFLAKTDL